MNTPIGMNRPRFLTLAAFGAAGTCALAAGCQLVAGIDDRSVYAPDGSPDSALGEAGSDAGDPCSGPGVPTAPDLSTSNSSDPVELQAALSMLHLGLDGDAGIFGFNLDHACTCPGPDTCQRPIDAGQACDYSGGVDNIGRQVFGLFASTGDGGFITEDTINQAIAQGLIGAFIRVRNYNGLADDAQVQVSVYASLGVTGFPTPPKFDGTDQWDIDEGSTNGGSFDQPKYSTTGYVRNHTLVASLKFPVIIGSQYISPITVELQSGLIVANIALNGSGPTATLKSLSGELAGRWESSKLLTSLQSVPDPFNDGGFLCKGGFVYEAAKIAICKDQDIASDPTNDGTGICDALSLGLGFEATPALHGPVKPSPANPMHCGASYSDICP